MPNERKLLDMPISSNQLLLTIYNVYDLPLYIQREQLSAFANRQTPLHWNDELETIYIVKGSMDLFANGSQRTLHEGEICIINAGCIHYFAANKESPDCTYICLLANESIFSYSPSIKEKYIDHIFHAIHPSYNTIGRDNPFYKQLLDLYDRLTEVLASDKPASELLIIAHFHEYIYLLWNAMQDSFSQAVTVNTKEIEAFRSVLSFIEQNYGSKITIEELCRAGSISRNKCFYLFRKYTNNSPTHYILDYRLEKASRFLTQTTLPLSQIASICGFSHQSHFAEYFKKKYQITPLQYRSQDGEQ